MWPQTRKRLRMPIVIDDPVLDALAHTLAEQRGESIADVIRQALEAQMPMEEVPQPAKTRAELLAVMEELGRKCSALVHTPFKSTDVDDLYDEWGLPR